ncbi:MAG: efflux RND transporter periplasmic adaptor subunit [Lysobacteraceae bacterium]|nr:efflux RND transporter periplasmic adaptor subunit [Xanthomonadales bacterium]HPF74684.1 efflux RND transporter periplasmic adaptor subunit [Xanthomonadaceae bacterium]HRY01075.1 efflux RND transporter periplasmic adaptor subunit [Xanthomonadaceae bacterium]
MHSQRTAGVVAALSLMMASAVSAQGGPGGMPPTAVETAQVETVTLDQSVDVIGNLRANESVTIRPEIAGRIEKIQFDEGQQVKAGDPLFTLDAALIRADLNEANANLALSQRSFDRAEDLIDRKLIAQSDYDSARSKLSVDRAKQASARTRLDKSVIRAPFSGVVGLRQVSVGEYASVGQALVDVVSIDPIKLEFAVPEQYLSRVKVGQAVNVRADAFPGERFVGEVYAVAPQIDLTTRSLTVRARVPNADGKLRPGQFSSVSLVLDRIPDAMMIPEQSLWPLGDKQFVYRVVDGKAEQVEVRTGQRQPGMVQILSGLNAGDTVITAGQQKIGPGSPVNPLPPKAAQNSNAPAQ